MNGTILLNYTDDTKKVEEEEQTRFLQNLLEQMGVPTNDIWNPDQTGPLDITQKMKLRELLESFNVQVIDDFDGGVKIYAEKTLVGEWFKCTFKLKRDFSQIDPKKQLYLEMEVNCWSLFEESDD